MTICCGHVDLVVRIFSSVTFAKCSRLMPVFSSDVFYLFKLRTKILKVCVDEVCEITVTYGDWLLFLIFGARKLEQSGSFHKSCLLVQRNPVSSLIFGEWVFFRHIFSRVNWKKMSSFPFYSIKPFACQRKLVLVNWAVEGTCNNTSWCMFAFRLRFYSWLTLLCVCLTTKFQCV